mgnify:CR=1 FL=1
MKKNNFSSLKAVFVNCTIKKASQTPHINRVFKVSKSIMEKVNVPVEEIVAIQEKNGMLVPVGSLTIPSIGKIQL